uniref:IP09848p n=1 Tax=Drosophila melanogaster TaxID=7227 RepID=Q4QQ75_DROME|nr:IP09848p [Drosophila melanogaster]
MASNPKKSLHQAIQAEFGLQPTSDLSKLSSISGTSPEAMPKSIPQLKIPQLRIPQLQLQTNADAAAEQEYRREAEAHNQMLLNEIQLRQRQRSEGENKPQSMGFVLPQLVAMPKEPLNIPLLTRLESGMKKLDIGDGTKVNTATSAPPLIDLTSTIIARHKGAPPKELASKARQLTNCEPFAIPFIACDRGRRSTTGVTLLASKRSINYDEDVLADRSPANSDYREQPGPIGLMLDEMVGYPEPRKPRLVYAVTPLERQHLRMCQYKDYGIQVKRFRFDTPSPDELVKQALQKSWRFSRT